MSKYDNIKTAADLVAEVAIHGLSTAQDDINRAQDIFGRSTIKELAALANDIGRNNDQGEPDPKGSWSSSRKATQETFYFLAFNIWNWREATAFYNEYTEPKMEEVRRLSKENKELTDSLTKTTTRYNAEFERAEINAKLIIQYDADKRQLTTDLEAARAEITALKVKLYDMMVA